MSTDKRSSQTDPEHTRQTATAQWKLLSSHALVLVSIARHGRIRMDDIATAVGITTRRVYAIVADLEAAHLVHRVRIGRSNHYLIDTEQPLTAVLGTAIAGSDGPSGHLTVGDLLTVLARTA